MAAANCTSAVWNTGLLEEPSANGPMGGGHSGEYNVMAYGLKSFKSRVIRYKLMVLITKILWLKVDELSYGQWPERSPNQWPMAHTRLTQPMAQWLFPARSRPMANGRALLKAPEPLAERNFFLTIVDERSPAANGKWCSTNPGYQKWIPDFQSHWLPENFPESSIKFQRNLDEI